MLIYPQTRGVKLSALIWCQGFFFSHISSGTKSKCQHFPADRTKNNLTEGTIITCLHSFPLCLCSNGGATSHGDQQGVPGVTLSQFFPQAGSSGSHLTRSIWQLQWHLRSKNTIVVMLASASGDRAESASLKSWKDFIQSHVTAAGLTSAFAGSPVAVFTDTALMKNNCSFTQGLYLSTIRSCLYNFMFHYSSEASNLLLCGFKSDTIRFTLCLS